MNLALLIQVLPALIGLVFQFINLVKTKGVATPGAIGAMSKALDDLKQAETHEDHMNAAKSLALALSGKSSAP